MTTKETSKTAVAEGIAEANVPRETEEIDSMAIASKLESTDLKKSEKNYTTFGKLKSTDIFLFKGVPYGQFRLSGKRYMDSRDGCMYTEKNDSRVVELLS